MDRIADDLPTVASALPGTAVVAGRYAVRSRLGRGATKEVFLAYDERLDREVALAIVVGGGDSEAARSRVEREAQLTGRLGDHPHVITVYDTGEHDGVPYLVLRAMRGGSLADVIARGRPSIEESLRFGREIAAGLAHAHAHGVVHRDVKPDNVWLDADGCAALGDFGIATQRGGERLTAEGVVLGTVRYLAPEQIRGREPGPASDLYALGITIYELVTGQTPFTAADPAQLLVQHLSALPVPPSQLQAAVPPALDRLILELLAKEPGQRPESAARVERELASMMRAPSATSSRDAAAGTADEPRPAFELPPVLSVRARAGLVGRESDLDRLWDRYEQASAGALRAVVLRGEPGIGKTRLATELARRAHADGATVLYGRCDEEPLLPHQPFVEALRHYVSACPPRDLANQVGRGGGELRRLVPELAERLPDLAEPLAGDPEGARYRLFEAVSALLSAAARAHPVVLVLDDLHWADKPTLLLLRHLVRSSPGAALLVIGTYRDTELDDAHPLSAALADLGREPGFERLALGPLDRSAVGSLVRSHAGDERAGLIGMIFEETEGNPFFVVEMLLHLAESDADVRPGEAGVPEGVKDVIGRRLARLAPATQRVLAVAAVSGRDFEYGVFEHISDLGEDELVDALDEGLRTRVIDEVAGTVGRYTFSHALIRETIYGELTLTRRALLHRRVAASLEQAHGEDLEPWRAELAHHLSLSGAAGDLEKAIDYGARAGDRAVAQLAYEQAAAHYRQAAGLIGAQAPPARQAQRCDLVLAQGEAERRAGDPAYRETLFEGARLAERLGDAERLARAALANNRGYFSTTAGVDRERVAVLEAALEAGGRDDGATRAQLLALVAVELVADPDWPHRAKLSDDALAMARRVGDPRTLSRTLNYRFATIWGPGTLLERQANCRESQQLADGLDDPFLAFYAAYLGSHAAMEAGDLALADELLERAGERARQLGQPTIDWYLAIGRAKRSSICGSLDEAEQASYAALALGKRAGQPDAFAWFANQLMVIRFLQGALGGDRPNFLKAAEMATPYATGGGPTGSRSVPLIVEATHIVTLCEVGRCEEVRGRFDELMRDDLSELPHDWASLAILALASVACAHLRDARRAAVLRALLDPGVSQFVDTGPSWFGATTHHLALLADTLGRHGEADERFAEAVDAYGALGATAWLTRARRDRARCVESRRH